MEKNRDIKNKLVQTYAEDMAKVIQDDREGLIKKIIHGEQEHEMEKKNISPTSRKNRFLLIMGLLFLSVSLGTLAFFFSEKENNTVPVGEQFIPIIFNDRSTFLEISGFNKERISQTMVNAVNTTTVKSGEVDGIYLTENKKIVGLRRFIDLIKGSFVPNSNPLLVRDNFLLGVVNSQNKETPTASSKDLFLIIKVRSTADIFDSLRAWEAKMFSDLHGLFGFDITSGTKYLLTAPFQNSIVGNKNARILYDKDNNIIMMYVLADDDSVVITNTENAAYEIMLRLASSKIKK